MKNIPYYVPEVCDGHECIMDCEAHCPYADEAMEYLAKQDAANAEINIYDEEEIYPNCTVTVWRNSVTGQESWGWINNED